MSEKKTVPDLFVTAKGHAVKRTDNGELVPKHRRTLNDIHGRVSLQVLYDKLVESEGWPYRTRDSQLKKYYQTRDRALIAALVLTGGRLLEVLALQKNQIGLSDNPKFMMISNFQVSKRKGGNAQSGVFLDFRPEVAIPLKNAPGLWSELVPFSNLFLDYLKVAPSKGKIFRLTDSRVQQIVDATLGIWPHYLRAICETHLLRIMKDSVVVGKYMKVNPDTLGKYVQADWRDFTK